MLSIVGSLIKFCDFKTTIDNSITSLHYLTANMLHTAPELELHRLPQDMPTVPSASRISTEALTTSIASATKALNCLKIESKETRLEHDRRALLGDQSLSKRVLQLIEFEEAVESVVASLHTDFQEASEAVYETARFFGDESAHQAGT